MFRFPKALLASVGGAVLTLAMALLITRSIVRPLASSTEAAHRIAAGELSTEVVAHGDAALKALYGHALGLVFPSLDEGFGLPPLEAMSLGCPVAAARAGAIPEVCGDAVLYFDPTSVPAIAAALQQLIANPELRQRLSAVGLQHAAAWTWASSAQTLSSLLWPVTEVRA